MRHGKYEAKRYRELIDGISIECISSSKTQNPVLESCNLINHFSEHLRIVITKTHCCITVSLSLILSPISQAGPLVINCPEEIGLDVVVLNSFSIIC